MLLTYVQYDGDVPFDVVALFHWLVRVERITMERGDLAAA